MTDAYVNPLTERYASAEMSRIFSPGTKFEAWRRLWLWLAEEERRLGLPISDEAIAEMRAHLSDIDFAAAAAEETKTRHDVMAHVRVFGEAAPAARGIIHLGATSAYVTDNADLLQMREGLALTERRLVSRDAATPRLRPAPTGPAGARLHALPARAADDRRQARHALGSDLLLDLEQDARSRTGMRFRGVKGTTGTQASFLDSSRATTPRSRSSTPRSRDRAGFERRQMVSGQTYTRKQDDLVVHVLSESPSPRTSSATDLRLLQHEGELEEPFESSQIGSSAMPYKRNPMRAERICSLARHVIALSIDTAMTAATQWLERTLDDSANKRIAVPEAFLATDAILVLLETYRGPRRPPGSLAAPPRGRDPVPRDRERHDGGRAPRRRPAGAAREAARARARLRRGSVGDRRPADLFDRVAADAAFGITREELEHASRPETLVGRSAAQVETFVREELDPALDGAASAQSAPVRV